jgi:nicotinic acid mononucleotide adenylyltransferase
MEDVNIIVGRFQPLTNGHLRCAREVYKATGNRTVLLVIETTKPDDRHPFRTSDLARLLTDTCKNTDYLAGWILVKNADIVKNAELLRASGYNPVSWSCGTDRYQSYSKMVERYKDKAGLPDDFHVIEIHRTDDDISATKVRQYISDGNKIKYRASVPGHWKNDFEYLRDLMMDITECRMISLSTFLSDLLIHS